VRWKKAVLNKNRHLQTACLVQSKKQCMDLSQTELFGRQKRLPTEVGTLKKHKSVLILQGYYLSIFPVLK